MSSITDRNGNQINLPTGSLPTSVTDSMNRQVTIIYADFFANPPRMFDEIKFKGFDQTVHGTDRSIKVNFANLENVLRSGSTQSTRDLFGALLDGSDTPFNPTVVSSVALPDGRQYQFRYNAFGELARVVLPTGGAIEYDYDGGVGPSHNSGVLVPADFQIYRRVTERRVYPDGGAGVGYESKTTYSRPENFNASGGNINDGFVLMEQRDASDNLLSKDKHFFFGGAAPTISRQPNDYATWNDGKEYQTLMFDSNGSASLRQMDHTWEQGTLPSQQPGPVDAAQNPRIAETLTTLKDATPNKVARQTFDYDVYNNATDTCDYDFGSGSFGSLLRHTHTDYLVDYANSTFNLAHPERNVHIRNLPRAQIVNANCANTLNQAARTDYEYDNYTPDPPSLKHNVLIDRTDISSHDSRMDTSYSTRGNVTAVTRWLNTGGSIASFQQYDTAGNVVKAIDPLDHVTTFDYADKFGKPDGSIDDSFAPPELSTGTKKTYALASSITNALGQTSHTQFNYYVAKPVDAKDLNGTLTSAVYQDALDRPTKLIQAANDTTTNSVKAQTTFAYDDSLSVRRITTKSDLKTFGDELLHNEVLYDGLGRTVETRQYESATDYIATSQTYDPLGRARQASNPYRSGDTVVWITTEYDGISRVKTMTTPDLAVVTTTYSGNQTTIRDQANKQRRSVTDGLGRLTSVDELLEHPSTIVYAATTYTYDLLDDLTGVSQTQTTPSVTQTRTFLYDSLRRLTQATNPESGLVQYTYDENGNLKTKTDARTAAVTTTYFYDAINRLTRRTYSGSATPQVDYFYDGQGLPTGAPSFTRGASIGRLVGVTYGGANSTAGSYQGYDILGRPNVSVQKTDAQSYTFAYGYNLAGGMTSETYPSGKVIQTEYDDAGRIAGVKKGTAYYAGAAATEAMNRIQYAAHGAISAMKLGNGKWEHTLFNNRLQPTEIGLGATNGASDLLKLEYTFGSNTNNGNVLTQKITAPKAAGGDLVLTQSYEYDEVNRLLSASENGSPAWSQTYDYDRYGNRAVRNGSYIPMTNIGLTPQSTSSTDFSAFDQQTNRLKQATFPNVLYDGAGNLARDQASRTFAYDGENRQTSYNNGAVTYTYDGDGRRVTRVIGNSTTIFVYNVAGQLIAEYASDPVPSPPGGGGTSYLTSDHLGSTRIVTTSAGGVKARYDYLPFGEEIESDRGGRTNVVGYGGADSTKQKFTQKERDSESGLDYFLARYYSSAQGRFTSVDPLNIVLEVQYEGNPKTARARMLGYLRDPRQWNRYAYAVNNPLLYIDPSGEEIIISGGTDEQQEAVRNAITRLRDQSPLADQAFARFDGTGYTVPNLNITILADKDFEAQITSNVDKSKAQGLTESGGITVDKANTANPTFIVNVNVSLRSSAIKLNDDQRDARSNSESRTEGILSHEVGGHAVDLSRNPREFQANTTRDKEVPYLQRANERSANAGSHRIVIQRLVG
ncbi:MAG: RHS repeat-associated core domain-containing protein, partial [Blastocatellia bacterium]